MSKHGPGPVELSRPPTAQDASDWYVAPCSCGCGELIEDCWDPDYPTQWVTSDCARRMRTERLEAERAEMLALLRECLEKHEHRWGGLFDEERDLDWLAQCRTLLKRLEAP